MPVSFAHEYNAQKMPHALSFEQLQRGLRPRSSPCSEAASGPSRQNFAALRSSAALSHRTPAAAAKDQTSPWPGGMGTDGCARRGWTRESFGGASPAPPYQRAGVPRWRGRRCCCWSSATAPSRAAELAFVCVAIRPDFSDLDAVSGVSGEQHPCARPGRSARIPPGPGAAADHR
jgi:hypothetical protein